nr:MAG TPA: hypothetical protein [Caudoviricetes sp.]
MSQFQFRHHNFPKKRPPRRAAKLHKSIKDQTKLQIAVKQTGQRISHIDRHYLVTDELRHRTHTHIAVVHDYRFIFQNNTHWRQLAAVACRLRRLIAGQRRVVGNLERHRIRRLGRRQLTFEVIFQEAEFNELLLAARIRQLHNLRDLLPRLDLLKTARARTGRELVQIARINAVQFKTVRINVRHTEDTLIQNAPTGQQRHIITILQTMRRSSTNRLSLIRDCRDLLLSHQLRGNLHDRTISQSNSHIKILKKPNKKGRPNRQPPTKNRLSSHKNKILHHPAPAIIQNDRIRRRQRITFQRIQHRPLHRAALFHRPQTVNIPHRDRKSHLIPIIVMV